VHKTQKERRLEGSQKATEKERKAPAIQAPFHRALDAKKAAFFTPPAFKKIKKKGVSQMQNLRHPQRG